MGSAGAGASGLPKREELLEPKGAIMFVRD